MDQVLLVLWINITHGVKNLFRKTMITFVLSNTNVCRCAPGMSKLATSCSLYASIIKFVTMAYKDTVGDEILLPSFKYFLFLLPSAHVRPFIIPCFFSFIGFTASNALFFCSLVRS